MGQLEQLPCARTPRVRQSDSVCEWAQSRVPHSILIVEEAPERLWQGLLGNAGKEQPRTALGTGGAKGWSAVRPCTSWTGREQSRMVPSDVSSCLWERMG